MSRVIATVRRKDGRIDLADLDDVMCVQVHFKDPADTISFSDEPALEEVRELIERHYSISAGDGGSEGGDRP